MTEQLQKAVDKIRDEMAANSANMALQAIGEMMTAHLDACPQDADKVLAEGKTLKGAYAAMESWARKNAKNGACCVVPKQAQKLVAEYYGVAQTQEPQAIADLPKPKAATDEFDLDALLAEV